MADVLLDTDVFVDHIRGAAALDPAVDAAYSAVTRAELFSGSRADEAVLRLLLGPFTEYPVDRAVAERAGRLRRGAAVRTPDALIAATALEHGLPLVTRNVRDFAAVPGLEVRAPR